MNFSEHKDRKRPVSGRLHGQCCSVEAWPALPEGAAAGTAAEGPQRGGAFEHPTCWFTSLVEGMLQSSPRLLSPVSSDQCCNMVGGLLAPCRVVNLNPTKGKPTRTLQAPGLKPHLCHSPEPC